MNDKTSRPGTPHRNGKGQFPKGVSGNRKGRPSGSRNRIAMKVQALFDENGQIIVEKITELALKKGDLTALKICIDRILPTQKSRPVTFALPEIKTAKDVVAAYGAILEAASEGQLTPEEASSLTPILEAMRRAMKSANIDKRLARIEAIVDVKE